MSDPDFHLPPWLQNSLRIGAFLGIAIGFVHAAFFSAQSATVALGAGILLLLLSEADKFEVLKGFGFEAKIHRLKATVDQAEKAIEQLQALALSNAKSIVLLVVSSQDGYVAVYSWKSEWEMVEGARKNLEELSISPSKVSEVLRPYDELVSQRIKKAIFGKAGNLEVNALVFIDGADRPRSGVNLTKTMKESHDPKEWIGTVQALFPANGNYDARLVEMKNDILELARDLDSWLSRRHLRRPEAYFAIGNAAMRGDHGWAPSHAR